MGARREHTPCRKEAAERAEEEESPRPSSHQPACHHEPDPTVQEGIDEDHGGEGQQDSRGAPEQAEAEALQEHQPQYVAARPAVGPEDAEVAGAARSYS